MMNKLTIVPLEEVNKYVKNTINELLDARITGLSPDHIEARMPMEACIHNKFGVLHNGALVVLAETVGSVGAALTVDRNKFRCLGLGINANHLDTVTSGIVTATAKPLHTDGNLQVWEIHIKNEEGKLVCVSRLTVAVVAVA